MAYYSFDLAMNSVSLTAYIRHSRMSIFLCIEQNFQIKLLIFFLEKWMEFKKEKNIN